MDEDNNANYNSNSRGNCPAEEPRWLDLDQQLYPPTTLTKRIVVENTADGLFEQIYSEVTYLSKTREIDVTNTLTCLIQSKYSQESSSFNYYGDDSYSNHFRVLYFDREFQRFRQCGVYPFDQKTLRLGEQFLQEELITFRLEPIQYGVLDHWQPQDSYNNSNQFSSSNKKVHSVYNHQNGGFYGAKKSNQKSSNLNQQWESESFQEGSWSVSKAPPEFQDSYSSKEQAPSVMGNKERTIKQVLQKLGEWRRINIQSDKKISLQEAAKRVEIPKRTLDDYYLQIKLAEKYGFNFEGNLNMGMGVLRKFVKQNHEKKKQQPFLRILQKFKNKD